MSDYPLEVIAAEHEYMRACRVVNSKHHPTFSDLQARSSPEERVKELHARHGIVSLDDKALNQRRGT